MNERWLRKALREKGLCGELLGDNAVCIQAGGHDAGIHEQRWEVSSCSKEDPHARDSRETIVFYQVTDRVRYFSTSVEAHATWLASVLNAQGEEED